MPLVLSNWAGTKTPVIMTISPGVQDLVFSPLEMTLNVLGMFPTGI